MWLWSINALNMNPQDPQDQRFSRGKFLKIKDSQEESFSRSSKFSRASRGSLLRFPSKEGPFSKLIWILQTSVRTRQEYQIKSYLINANHNLWMAWDVCPLHLIMYVVHCNTYIYVVYKTIYSVVNVAFKSNFSPSIIWASPPPL